MRSMCELRLVLVVIIAVLVLRAVPAYSSDVTALAIDPLTPTTLYAGTYGGGVFKSTDEGANWTATGLTSVFVTVLAIDPQTPSTVYAGTSGGGVFKSIDGGESWSGINAGLSNLSVANLYVANLAVDPQTPTTLYALISNIYCSLCPDTGAYKTTDGGANWSAIVMPPGGVWATPVHAVTALAIDPQKTSTLYAGVYYVQSDLWFWGEVLKSTDGGASWISTGLIDESGGYFGALAIDPQTPSTVYVGDYGAVYKSTDGGAGWGGSTTGLTYDYLVQSLAIDPLAPTILYAVISNAGVLKSTDASATWSAVNTGLTETLQAPLFTLILRDLVIDPRNPTNLYLGTVAGVFKSTDSAATWSPTGLIPLSPLTAVSLSPTSVTGGTASTGTVILNTPAPADGVTVSLSSSQPAIATVPASVTVPAGATSASFTASTSSVTAISTDVTISAAFDGATRSAVLFVYAPTTLASVSLSPTSVTGGTASTGTVTLSAAAPAGGATITLSSSNTAVATVPPNVTVPAGATSATFTVAASPVSTTISVTISGISNGVTRSAELTVIAATTLSSVGLNPTNVIAGNPSTGTVTLNMAAPAGGAVVTLSSSNPAVATIPTSVTVTAGATSATFTVSTNSLTGCNSSVATISATYSSVTKSGGLTVTPAKDSVAIQQADYFTYRHELRVTATSTGSTAALQVYVTSTGELIGTLKHYDGNRYSGQFAWPVNPQNITVRSSLCGAAMKAVAAK